MTDDWPTFSEELTRKGSEQLAKWVAAFDAGKITDRELFIVANAIWDTVSGLADKELLRNLEQVIEEIRQMRKAKSG
ncbi:hypothetical protein [Shinella zoogloeoides]|uniref:hypothetical protein n=1 Tax=Shinella zoogloeoides TaxID=352475 RepID=UPI00273FA56B|nr:hypothetical protein [Shinella zoogloeoides]WLR90906.1 hypothetical protein Q9316_00585 [Shinella zoogloeoides]